VHQSLSGLLPLVTPFPGWDERVTKLSIVLVPLLEPNFPQEKSVTMRYAIVLFAITLSFCSQLLAQDSNSSGDHFEGGVFADYFNLSRTSPHINFVGLGARAAFNVNPRVQIEAEMSYDFERNFSSVFSNGITSQLVRTNLRPLHALFGPKFETNAGRFRAFATFKAGFVNFSTSNSGAASGFNGALGSVTSGDTRPAIYPGVGLEGFWGPIGLRLDAGDSIYFDNGARNNFKVTFGPAIRF